jgi:hypothetical protein
VDSVNSPAVSARVHFTADTCGATTDALRVNRMALLANVTRTMLSVTNWTRSVPAAVSSSIPSGCFE